MHYTTKTNFYSVDQPHPTTTTTTLGSVGLLLGSNQTGGRRLIVRPGDVRNLNSRGEVVKSRRESGSNGAFGNGNGMSRDGDGSGGGSGSDDYWNRGGVGTTSIVPHIHNNSSSSGSDDVSKEKRRRVSFDIKHHPSSDSTMATTPTSSFSIGSSGGGSSNTPGNPPRMVPNLPLESTPFPKSRTNNNNRSYTSNTTQSQSISPSPSFEEQHHEDDSKRICTPDEIREVYPTEYMEVVVE